MSITLCCLSGGDAGRLGALLELCRDVVDEIVVALDDRCDAARLGRVPELADRIVLVPFEPPVERTLPWLYARCAGSWILRLDDDEVPSRSLLDTVRELASDEATNVWLPRRWLHPDARRVLDTHPWVPDFQLRLSVNDPRLVRFPGLTHVPIEVAGAARYAAAPVYHLDLLRPYEERVRKAERYEAARPGLRLAGRAFNHALYLPEDVDAPHADVPPEDAALIARVLAAPPPGASDPPTARATRSEIDEAWGRDGAALAAELVLRRAPERLEAGERAQVELLVRNRGETPLVPPAVQLATRWRGGAPGPWTPLPAPLRAGAEQIAVATVVAPPEHGRQTLEIELVRADAPTGASVSVGVEIAARRRVGVFVRDATRGRAAPLAAEIARLAPAVEPVVVGGVVDGYAALPGPGPAVVEGLAPGRRRLASLAVAERRVRAAAPLDVDALVLAGLDASTLLERWADLAAVRVVAAAGGRILVPPPPAPRGRLDALLLRRLLRTPGVEVGEELPRFLARLHSARC